MRFILLTMWALFSSAADANYPVFEAAGQLKQLLVPADVHIGSVIYRLRASDSDHDYPLQFDATDYGSYVVKVENLPCNVNSTYCEANVYLERVLMVGQVFKFRFTVRDTKGDTTTASVSIEVTDAPVDITNIFPHLPGIIILPENTKPGTELEYVIVRRNPEHKKPAILEIRGSNVLDFGRMRSSQETTTGVITLKRGLDFESQNMYKLQIFALDMYTDKLVDSRNIAGFEIILIVEDVQDTPPIFINTDPTTKLRSNLTQGDIITKVTAIDGDRGNPRPINYGIVSENNPFTIFFNIDRFTGQITLAKPLKQLTAIARSHQPILLTIVAEEQRSNIKEPPAMSTTATIALLLAEAGNTPPYFDNDHYVCHLDENSPQGATLVFSDAYSTQVHDDDMGKQGVFSLILEKNNGTFEISPNIVERKASFTIRVRNNLLLDYDNRKSVEFVIVARELDPGSLSSSVTVLVYLNDVNDNPPQFERTVYMAQIPENATANAYIAEVEASDIDTGLFGRVHYTRILGFRNSSLLLNSVTGVITVASDNHGFDREEASEYHLTVEARDMEGVGLLATVPIIIRVLDVNDETPTFENAPFHFTMTADLKNFSTRAFVKAIDKDAEPPNNIVRYEIISGNYNNKFILNSETGELTVRYSDGIGQLRKRRQAVSSSSGPGTMNVYTLTVRAYDLGVPHRWSTAQIRVFPPDTGTRLLSFVMPAKGLDYAQLEELLMRMTGGQVTIVEIKPYHHTNRYIRAVAEPIKAANNKEKSVVVARVNYGDNSMVDVDHVYYMLHSMYRNSDAAASDQLQYKPTESSMSVYWILLLIMLLLLALFIALLLCYLSKCHPCYTLFGEKKKNQVSDAAQTVNLSSKGVQANNHRLGTHSSTDSGYRNRWKFYRRREHDSQPVFLIPKSSMSPVHYRKSTNVHDEMPAFIYRTDISSSVDRHAGDLFVQDIADSDYHILDPAKLNVQRLNDPEAINNRTKQYNNVIVKNSHERIRRNVSSPGPREETFVREGQAEILRLQTNDDSLIEEQTLLHRPDKPSYYNHFDTNDTSKTSTSHTEPISKQYDIHNGAITQIEQIISQKQLSINPPLQKEDQLQQPEELAREKPVKLHRSKHVDVEESAIATVVEADTTAAISHTSSKQVADIEQPPVQNQPQSTSLFEESWLDLPQEAIVVNGPSTSMIENATKPSSEGKMLNGELKNEDTSTSYHYHPVASSRTIDDNRTQAVASSSSEPQLTDAFRATILDAAHLEEERNRLHSFQRDILLTRFLVEEQRRFFSTTQTVDTQSLPGSLSMGTQTDRHRSTQTDVLCLLRPEPRKVKSENDDSSDSELDCSQQLPHHGHKKGYRRCYSVMGKDKARYKIRTPIMEEAENTEGGVKSSHVSSSSQHHRQNKSSILRMAAANNSRKSSSTKKESSSATTSATTTTPSATAAKSKLAKSKYKSSGDLRSTNQHHPHHHQQQQQQQQHQHHHVSLCDVKKSVSYTNINDDSRIVLSDKEMYTPRSLKSRIIARRLSASEPPKIGDHQSRRQDFKQNRSSTYDEKDTTSHFEPCKKCELRRKEGTFNKMKCKHSSFNKTPNPDQKTATSSSGSTSNTSHEGKLISVNDDGENLDANDNHTNITPPISATSTLKLKSKNQQLMEKKSVFTIAYDDAATQHLGNSSNGSVHEHE